jgi:hypothetical protein
VERRALVADRQMKSPATLAACSDIIWIRQARAESLSSDECCPMFAGLRVPTSASRSNAACRPRCLAALGTRWARCRLQFDRSMVSRLVVTPTKQIIRPVEAGCKYLTDSPCHCSEVRMCVHSSAAPAVPLVSKGQCLKNPSQQPLSV